MKIYHNPRCRKSREALALLQEKKIEFSIVDYLKHPLKTSELTEILGKLNYTALELIRKNEPIWKEEYKGKNLSDSDLIALMCKSPKLMERPIIVTDKSAVVGRPIEVLIDFLKKLA